MFAIEKGFLKALKHKCTLYFQSFILQIMHADVIASQWL